VVCRAGEHALELGLPETRIERLGLRGGVGDDGLVVLGGAELEVLGEVAEILLDAPRELELGLDLRALAERALGLLVVVPEAGGEGELVQLLELSGEPSDVKDAPLAPHGAFEGRQFGHGSR
jgi:hypothetical protein